jgi:hypothetical protein
MAFKDEAKDKEHNQHCAQHGKGNQCVSDNSCPVDFFHKIFPFSFDGIILPHKAIKVNTNFRRDTSK